MKKAFAAGSSLRCSLLVLLCLAFFQSASSQNPGNIGTANLTLWLKADGSTSTNHQVFNAAGAAGNSVDGGVVNHWDNLNPGGMRLANLAQTTTGQQPLFYNTQFSNLFNFNPVVLFDGSNDVLRSVSTPGTNIFSPAQNTIFQVINYRGPDGTGVWFKWETANTEGNRIGYESTNASFDYMRFDVFNATNCTATGPCPDRINNGNTRKIDDCYRVTTAHHDNRQSITRMDGFLENTANFGSATNVNLTTSQPLNLGANSTMGAGDFWTNIAIAEIIVYNTRLAAADIEKIETYLGVKYGLSLGHNYVSSNGTVVWNTAANPVYNYGIIGLGTDAATGLQQRQSMSMSRLNEANPERDILTLYLGNKQANNQLNTTAFGNPTSSFFLVGSNRATALALQTTENPVGAVKTLNREWFSQQNSFTNSSVNLQFDLSSTTMVVPTSGCQKLAFVMDKDGDFTNGRILTDIESRLTKVGNVYTVTLSYQDFLDYPYFTFALIN
ncbi:MAG: hypothetical protein V4616_08600, partial [Bacteroidota bacterium]